MNTSVTLRLWSYVKDGCSHELSPGSRTSRPVAEKRRPMSYGDPNTCTIFSDMRMKERQNITCCQHISY